jgi:hypothetical protein
VLSELFATIADGRWRPGIGDPTALGWTTVATYLAGALICWRAAVAARGIRWPSYYSGEPLFWLLCAAFLFCLGINKQLDLQTWFTVVGKGLARDMGWYAQRRIVQAIFIMLIGLAGLVLLVVGVWWTGQLRAACRVALAGVVFLGIFVIIRAASFHHVDQMLGMRLGGLRINVLMEMGGALCIAAAGCSTARPRRAVHTGGYRQVVQSVTSNNSR